MTHVSVTWDGEEICATILVALAMAPTVQVMGCATLLFTSAHVTKAGLAVGVKFPTVQGPLTASNEEYATPLWIPRSVRIVLKDGWVQHVTILAHTVNKFQWTVATAFASQAGSV